MDEMLILVDENDREVGICEKMAAHRQALLHRAFSIFIFNAAGQILLQRRAWTKYHSPGLWTNACCSHPRPGEMTHHAAGRRLREELGIGTELHWAFSFTYEASFENGLSEREFDHVFIGYYDGEMNPNPGEVAEYAYKSIDEVKASLAQAPGDYSIWFKQAFPLVIDHLRRQKSGR